MLYARNLYAIDYCKAHPGTTRDEFNNVFTSIDADTLKVNEPQFNFVIVFSVNGPR